MNKILIIALTAFISTSLYAGDENKDKVNSNSIQLADTSGTGQQRQELLQKSQNENPKKMKTKKSSKK